jgi:RNA polymerase sigma factor (sigma-70 family)
MMGEPDSAAWTNTVDEAPDGRQMLQRVATGDREAFHAFYACYGARVMAMVRRQVAAQQMAEELVQDVFVAAWLGASGYREEMGDPERWLLGITRHKLQDHWRRLRGLMGAVGAHAEHARLEARVPDADLRLTVEEALSGLPSDQRQVLDLIYQGGLTFRETAHALKVPPGTVKSRVHAALLTLRVFFRRSGQS